MWAPDWGRDVMCYISTVVTTMVTRGMIEYIGCFAHGYVLYVQFKDNQKGLNLASQIQS